MCENCSCGKGHDCIPVEERELQVGFLFAMEEEIAPYIKRYGWEKIQTVKNQSLYIGEFQEHHIFAMVSGVGTANAVAAASVLLSLGADAIFNIGCCGANHSKLNIGDIVVPTTFYDGEFDLSAFGKDTKDPFGVNDLSAFSPNIISPEEGITCYTCSHFVTEPIADGDYIVDMESYHLACLCSIHKVPFVCIKGVSDNANRNSVTDIDLNVAQVMENTIPVAVELFKREESVFEILDAPAIEDCQSDGFYPQVETCEDSYPEEKEDI